jgi:hypothetical protein
MAGTICLFYSEGIVPCTTLFREKGEALAAELGGGAEFSQFDIDNAAALRAALNGEHTVSSNLLEVLDILQALFFLGKCHWDVVLITDEVQSKL